MALDQEIIDYLRDSAETYRFLSQMVFKELNAEAIAAVAEIEFPAETGNAHLDEGYRLVRRYFRFSAEDRRPVCTARGSALRCPMSRCSRAPSASWCRLLATMWCGCSCGTGSR